MKTPTLSPKKYIIKKARNFPFHEALVQESYYTGDGIATVVVSRQEPSGKFTVGIFLLDIFCLGIKNANYKCHLFTEEYEELKEMSMAPYGYKTADLTFAHNLIYGALDYAEELGFKPHPDFSVAEYVLDPGLVDEGIDDIEFGREGKPYYIAGPFDQPDRIIKTLQKSVGDGNFHFLTHIR
jgi:hypothetical protein